MGGGWADAGRSRPWRGGTLVMPYSLSKAWFADPRRGPGHGAHASPARTDRCATCSAHSCTPSCSPPKSLTTTRPSASRIT
ncbi:hypothetical protein QQM39_10200 [Streptomyces sp. DT2A-34]|uniref:hypothetical protein n=1 Tax=Streptomyces sp. DT2A-34 TaxID=3051182 RepID=UPI00265C7079|nr:hypothetical protein [Streptomyces sp. DT2A-34]MDO0911213.1 hypothetical protein [Streptomyces sp. DT2A-34]